MVATGNVGMVFRPSLAILRLSMSTVTSPRRRVCYATFLAAALVPALVGAEEIRFGGYTWTVRSGRGGPGPNAWDAKNVWLDAATNLHLNPY